MHIISDRPQSSRLAHVLLRVPVPWVFVLTYLVGVAVERVFRPGNLFRDYRWLTPLGLVIFIVGALVAAWGWILFYRARTTRVPGEDSSTLVAGGPYRWTRNPMYVGLAVAYIGEAAILHQIVPILLLPLTITYLNRVVIPVEEERLRAVFGTKYEQYQKQVPRWF